MMTHYMYDSISDKLFFMLLFYSIFLTQTMFKGIYSKTAYIYLWPIYNLPFECDVVLGVICNMSNDKISRIHAV